MGIRDFLRNPFSFLGQRSGREDRLAEYVIREHGRGRSLDEILNDRYLQNRASPQELARLLDRPEVIRAISRDDLDSARGSIGPQAP